MKALAMVVIPVRIINRVPYWLRQEKRVWQKEENKNVIYRQVQWKRRDFRKEGLVARSHQGSAGLSQLHLRQGQQPRPRDDLRSLLRRHGRVPYSERSRCRQSLRSLAPLHRGDGL